MLVLIVCLVLVGASLIALGIAVFELFGHIARLRRALARLEPLPDQLAALTAQLPARSR